jgi:hypothetical protein
LIISDNQDETCLIITINDTSLGYLPLIINISDTCKNQPKRLDFDNTINLSSLIMILGVDELIQESRCFKFEGAFSEFPMETYGQRVFFGQAFFLLHNRGIARCTQLVQHFFVRLLDHSGEAKS